MTTNDANSEHLDDIKSCIFLDIDGVLNSMDYMHALHALKHRAHISEVKTRDEFGQLFDDRCVAWLRFICAQSNVYAICLISSWAVTGNHKTMQRMWLNRNMPGYLIPSIYEESYDQRFTGVYKYIKAHNIQKYVIIDDAIFDNEVNFVHIDDKFGLCRENALKAIRILTE